MYREKITYNDNAGEYYQKRYERNHRPHKPYVPPENQLQLIRVRKCKDPASCHLTWSEVINEARS